jgi:quercetin dioxygenase-like cupin family protein
MAGIEVGDFGSANETRTPPNTKIELVNIAGGQIGRYTFQPGWRWSEHIKPVAKTDSCQVEHIGFVISGSLLITHDDGSRQNISAGQVYRIAPGHDGYNAGSEPAVVVEFQGAANYGKS